MILFKKLNMYFCPKTWNASVFWEKGRKLTMDKPFTLFRSGFHGLWKASLRNSAKEETRIWSASPFPAFWFVS